MIVDVFIMVAIMAFILMIIAYVEESVAWTSLSILFWIFLLALSMNIEIPYQAATEFPAGSGIMNVTTGTQMFYEPAFTVIIFGILIFNIVLLIKEIVAIAPSWRFNY